MYFGACPEHSLSQVAEDVIMTNLHKRVDIETGRRAEPNLLGVMQLDCQVQSGQACQERQVSVALVAPCREETIKQIERYLEETNVSER